MGSDDWNEWLKLIARWAHVFAAFLWIGQTYLFHFFERNMGARGGGEGAVSDGDGKVWMVHGGGFFVVEKLPPPARLPAILHWFKWEAAATWASGVVLLTAMYYMGGLLVEPQQSYRLGLFAGIGALIAGWLVYDLLVRSPLGRHDVAFAVVSLLLLLGTAAALRQVLSSRATYLHVGAMLGTIMAANVWNRILPSQRRMIAALRAGQTPDLALLATGPQRSKHNSFMVVPLVFLMISNHFPTITYGSRHSLVVLGVMMVAGWAAARWLRSR